LAPAFAWIHLAIGLALLVARTRIVAALGIALLLNYAAAQGQTIYSANDAPSYLALLVAVWLGNAGLSWGLDGFLARRATRRATT
jgi:hypothetical protein